MEGKSFSGHAASHLRIDVLMSMREFENMQEVQLVSSLILPGHIQFKLVVETQISKAVDNAFDDVATF